MLVGDVVRIDEHILQCLLLFLSHAYVINLPETLSHYFSKMQCVAVTRIVSEPLLQERIYQQFQTILYYAFNNR